jgi:O-antigen ligase
MASFIMIAAVAAVILLKPLREDILETAAEIQQILSGDNNIYAGNGRWGMWQYVAGIIADYPVWGYGCEGIASMMLDYALTANPHNEPLTYAAFFGIPAAVFYCSAVLITVFKGIGRRRECRGNMVAAYAAAAYFMSSIFGVAMFYTAPFMFVFLGVASSDTCD